MSWRSASAMARSTLRPMRPNPLMATRTVIAIAPGRVSYSRSLHFPKLAQGRRGDRIGCYAKMFIKVFIGRAGAEPGHADKGAVGADDGVPPFAHRGFDADLNLGIADNRAPRRL